jgi:nicotinamide-nucleotide amidase
MPSAEIIAIGTELLLGETVDTNTAFITKTLNKIGIDIFRTVIVGDNSARITDQIKQSLNHADIVITTGGLGPTVDDPTRQAVADAFDQELVFKQKLWEQILARFQKFNKNPTSNNKKQAFIPNNAISIENEVGTAPAFYISESGKTIISLPGVPAEMKYLINEKVITLLTKLHHLQGTIFSRIIHTAGIGESSIDNLIGDLEKLKNPTVGVTAKPGQVNIRITAKAKDKKDALKIILPIEKTILNKVGDYVFGYDKETLKSVVAILIQKKKINISIIYKNLNKEFINQIKNIKIFHTLQSYINVDQKPEEIDQSLYNKSYDKKMTVILDEYTHPKAGFALKIKYRDKSYEKEMGFGGHNILLNSWMENYLLNTIREVILQKGEK